MSAARLLLPALALAPLVPTQTSPPPCADRLLTVSPADNLLRVVDPLTGVTQSSLTIRDVTGRTVSRVTGIARHPQTGLIYVMMHLVGLQDRELAVLNPANGQATPIGSTGDRFAAITFDMGGTLYGVTGDGGNVPETLYTIDINNASTTLVMPLGNGNDGEVIAFNPRDGLLYHASGWDGCLPMPGCGEIFEKIDLTGPTITNIPLSGFDYTEALALTPIGESGNFLMTDLNDVLCLISDQGFVTQIAAMDAPTKGMVFLPEIASRPYFRHYGFGCPAQNGAIAWLTGRGCPRPGQTITLELLNAPRSAFGLLLVGLGPFSIPLPSAACPIQVLPVTVTLGFTTDPAGAARFPLPVPVGLPPADFFFQIGVLDGTTAAVVSNPLEVHLR